MGKGLTVRAVEAATATVRREIPDGYLPGLYLIVHPTGAKAWAVRYRHRGQSRKLTLGGYPLLDLKAARESGSKALRAVAEGRDPGREKAQARTSQSDVESVVEQFLERHVRRQNRPKTIREVERVFQKHVLPSWRGRDIEDINRRDVIDLVDSVVESGAPIMANRVLATVRKLFSWMLSRDLIVASPCAGVKPPAAERARDRSLSDEELKCIWQAADKIGYPVGSLIKLLILSGQRRGEVSAMLWSELDLDKRLWTLPPERTKNGQRHEVPLSAAAMEILTSVPRTGDFVLSFNGAAPIGSFSTAKRKLDTLAPVPAWKLHDLRRTAVTGMARLGITLPVIEKVVNHSSGSFAGIVSVYQRHSFADEKRAALESWGRFVTDLVR